MRVRANRNSETVFVHVPQINLCAKGSVFSSYFGEAKMLECQSASTSMGDSYSNARQELRTYLPSYWMFRC
jgi:hypothetical protein